MLSIYFRIGLMCLCFFGLESLKMLLLVVFFIFIRFTIYPNMNLSCLKDSVYLSSQLHIPAELYSSGSVGYWVCHCWWEHSPDNSSQQASLPSTDWWLPGRLVSTCCLPSARAWELRACKTSSLMTVMGSLYRWKFRKRFHRLCCCDLQVSRTSVFT